MTNYFDLNSSSLHVINADHKMTLIQKFFYFVLNIVNNLFDLPPRLASLRIIKFVPTRTKDDFFHTLTRTSPSRYLSNMFWRSLNFDYIREILKENLKIVDVGCGSGNYRNILKLSDGDTYLGVDIFESPNWASLKDASTSFVEIDFLQVDQYLSDKNLLITQSALEHFEKDLLFFRKVSRLAEIKNQKLLQIHLFPAKSCLWTYLYHGIRQYNFRSIRQIIKESGPDTIALVVNLGSGSVNRFHLNSITKHQALHRYSKMYTSKNGYADDLRSVIEKDRSRNSVSKPSFFALILAHNFDDGCDLAKILK